MPTESARRTDPVSSHIGVDAISKWTDLQTEILNTVTAMNPHPVTDTEITELLNKRRTSLRLKNVQRNVVAKSRRILEENGCIVRLRPRPSDKQLLLFCLPTNLSAIEKYGKSTKTKKSEYISINDSFCVVHRRLFRDCCTWRSNQLECEPHQLYIKGQ